MKIYGIVFKENGKIYNFKSEETIYQKSEYVIVETEKGLQYGKIVSTDSKSKESMDLRPIIRLADEEDSKKYRKNLVDAEKALEKAKEFVEELGLEMNILDSSYTFDKKQLLFNFLADGRIDFRELAKKLAGQYKTRIELRQIGVRDKAKEIGGLGQCGRQLCCASFLNRIDAVTINMAKNQNIALNPNKINGACGRLLCCLAYEDENYTMCQKGLPAIGSTIKRNERNGKVIDVNILERKYILDYDGEKEEVYLNENCNK